MMVVGFKQTERTIWIILLLVIVAGSVLVMGKFHKTLTEVDQTVKDLEREKTSWTQREADLTTEISDLKAKVAKQTEEINKRQGADPTIAIELERKGLNGGPDQVIADLLKHNELIPYEGVLGGTMSFFEGSVVSNKWVLAYFEDGHMGGYMLLGYSVKNGIISWKVIDSYLQGQ